MGPRRIARGPEGDRAARVAVPESSSRAGQRSDVPGRGVLRRPRRGPGQVRDGAPGQRGRRLGHHGGGGVRVLPARPTTPRPPPWRTPGWKDWSRPGPARAPGTSSPTQVLTWAEQQLAADPGLRPARAGRTDRRARSACTCTPARSSARWPAAGSALQKPLTCPPASRGKEEHPSLSLRPSPGHAAAEPGGTPSRMPARTLLPAAGWTPATSTFVMPSCTTRAERVPARARRADRQGRHRLAARPGDLTSPTPPAPGPAPRSRPAARPRPGPAQAPASWPQAVTAELVHALAGLAVARPAPDPLPPAHAPGSPPDPAGGKEHPVFTDTAASKVTAAHLSRTALLYVRQSTPQAGPAQHRVRDPPVRPARQGDRAGLGRRPDHRDRHRPGPVRRQRRRPGRVPAAGRRGLPRAGPGSCSAWNAPGWPATPPTGTSCSNCAG